ncbi:unnamed protein product [Acanthoscelides obtectus]|uniref:Uncharacterized protein n=1 Tax=Acanthoscelides obtectus TaxID=200917 RepID=A0A9P0K4H2_ACAOB|nr:unnamed protein product [Acanthoscelides obtectus]CAK1632640.1 hypothetical protein AOBTE_LOCUS7660 [Acanthoscelides obtectus]
MRPNRLERHLKQQHPTVVLKTKEFFSSKAGSLKRMRLDKSGSYHTASNDPLAKSTTPATGRVTRPTAPLPNPLKKPSTPCSLAPVTGFLLPMTQTQW